MRTKRTTLDRIGGFVTKDGGHMLLRTNGNAVVACGAIVPDTAIKLDVCISCVRCRANLYKWAGENHTGEMLTRREPPHRNPFSSDPALR